MNQTYYTLMRTTVPAGAHAGANVETSLSSAPWFVGFRFGSHLKLSIWGEITLNAVQDLVGLFSAVESVELLIRDCSGGDCAAAATLMSHLLPIRERVNCHVKGYCNSAAASHLLPVCGLVSCDWDATFLFHAQRITWTIPTAEDPVVSKLTARLDEGARDLEKILALRVKEPARLLDAEHHLDAAAAKEIGLVDQMRYL